MRIRFTVLLFLTMMTTSLVGQVVEKCDTRILLSINKKTGQLMKKEIGDFLLTYGKECRNNAEYSEWSNELLIEVLDKQTELTLKTVEKLERRLEKDEILNDLSNPIYESIDIKALIAKIDQVKINDRLKNEIIDSLKKAVK